ncbi:hypothetical protein HDU77_004387 [Chytriomyces hyalinus]|nr:hypothetical protein HDU77_004387 [Chytriomyces hyalinus]
MEMDLEAKLTGDNPTDADQTDKSKLLELLFGDGANEELSEIEVDNDSDSERKGESRQRERERERPTSHLYNPFTLLGVSPLDGSFGVSVFANGLNHASSVSAAIRAQETLDDIEADLQELRRVCPKGGGDFLQQVKGKMLVDAVDAVDEVVATGVMLGIEGNPKNPTDVLVNHALDLDEKPISLSMDNCSTCLGGGDLLCCDSCPRVFHFCCVESPVDPLDVPTFWECKECLWKRSCAKATLFSQSSSKRSKLETETLDQPLQPKPQSSLASVKKLKQVKSAFASLDKVIDSRNPRIFDLPPSIWTAYNSIYKHPLTGDYIDLNWIQAVPLPSDALVLSGTGGAGLAFSRRSQDRSVGGKPSVYHDGAASSLNQPTNPLLDPYSFADSAASQPINLSTTSVASAAALSGLHAISGTIADWAHDPIYNQFNLPHPMTPHTPKISQPFPNTLSSRSTKPEPIFNRHMPLCFACTRSGMRTSPANNLTHYTQMEGSLGVREKGDLIKCDACSEWWHLECVLPFPLTHAPHRGAGAIVYSGRRGSTTELPTTTGVSSSARESAGVGSVSAGGSMFSDVIDLREVQELKRRIWGDSSGWDECITDCSVLRGCTGFGIGGIGYVGFRKRWLCPLHVDWVLPVERKWRRNVAVADVDDGENVGVNPGGNGTLTHLRRGSVAEKLSALHDKEREFVVLAKPGERNDGHVLIVNDTAPYPTKTEAAQQNSSSINLQNAYLPAAESHPHQISSSRTKLRVKADVSCLGFKLWCGKKPSAISSASQQKRRYGSAIVVMPLRHHMFRGFHGALGAAAVGSNNLPRPRRGRPPGKSAEKRKSNAASHAAGIVASATRAISKNGEHLASDVKEKESTSLLESNDTTPEDGNGAVRNRNPDDNAFNTGVIAQQTVETNQIADSNAAEFKQTSETDGPPKSLSECDALESELPSLSKADAHLEGNMDNEEDGVESDGSSMPNADHENSVVAAENEVVMHSSVGSSDADDAENADDADDVENMEDVEDSEEAENAESLDERNEGIKEIVAEGEVVEESPTTAGQLESGGLESTQISGATTPEELQQAEGKVSLVDPSSVQEDGGIIQNIDLQSLTAPYEGVSAVQLSQNAVASASPRKRGRPSKKFRCCVPNCGKLFTHSWHLTRHANTHDPQMEAALRCRFPGCGKLFLSQYHVDRHFKSHLNGTLRTPMSGDSAGNGFDTASVPPANIVAVPVKKPIKAVKPAKSSVAGSASHRLLCSVEGCGKRFVNSWVLERHTRTHSSLAISGTASAASTVAVRRAVASKKVLHTVPAPVAGNKYRFPAVLHQMAKVLRTCEFSGASRKEGLILNHLVPNQSFKVGYDGLVEFVKPEAEAEDGEEAWEDFQDDQQKESFDVIIEAAGCLDSISSRPEDEQEMIFWLTDLPVRQEVAEMVGEVESAVSDSNCINDSAGSEKTEEDVADTDIKGFATGAGVVGFDAIGKTLWLTPERYEELIRLEGTLLA